MIGTVLTGCKTLSTVKSGFNDLIEEDVAQIEMVVPERTLVKRQKVPSHSRFVIAAIVEEMRDRGNRVKQVVFDKQGRHTLRDPGFAFSGFDLILVDIGGYRLLENGRQRTMVRMDGVLHFADDIGRACSSSFAVRYLLRPGRAITVLESAVRHLPPAFPAVTAFYVPAEKVNASRGQLRTFRDYYLMASANAIPMRATEAEIAAKEKEKSLSTWQKVKKASLEEVTERDVVIMVFCLERLAPEAGFEVKLTAEETVHGTPLASTVYFDDAGWRIAAIGGSARLNSKSAKFFVYATYEPDPKALERPILVGKFSSLKDYRGRPQPQQRSSRTATAGTSGPVGSGEVMLNPARYSDAVKIQRRLADLGYYTFKVDGAFGRGSRAALKAFRQNAGLGGDSRWDLTTQKALFRGTGL
jgi:hypothetical protein